MVSVKVLEKVGIRQAINVAHKMGIKSELPNVPSIALGSPSISMLEMVNAYAVFANEGNHLPSVFVTAIADSRGNVIEEFDVPKEGQPALSPATADMMIHMMKAVVNEGTATSLRSRYSLQNDIAGKTGTTQDNADGWFIGVTPNLVIGAWVGADDPRLRFRSTALGQGSATALPIVGKMLQHANKDKNLRYYTNAKFEPLDADLAARLHCDTERSDRNFFERLFKTKRKVKEKKFKSRD